MPAGVRLRLGRRRDDIRRHVRRLLDPTDISQASGPICGKATPFEDCGGTVREGDPPPTPRRAPCGCRRSGGAGVGVLALGALGVRPRCVCSAWGFAPGVSLRRCSGCGRGGCARRGVSLRGCRYPGCRSGGLLRACHCRGFAPGAPLRACHCPGCHSGRVTPGVSLRACRCRGFARGGSLRARSTIGAVMSPQTDEGPVEECRPALIPAPECPAITCR
jgi:hypothetical protein